MKLAAALMVVLLAATGCISIPQQISSFRIDSCSLLPTESIERRIGFRFERSGANRGTPTSNTCVYESTDPKATMWIDAAVGMDAGIAWNTRSHREDESIGGLRDNAFWFPPYKVLHVLAGRAFFAVQIFGIPEPEAKRLAVALAPVIARTIEPIAGT